MIIFYLLFNSFEGYLNWNSQAKQLQYGGSLFFGMYIEVPGGNEQRNTAAMYLNVQRDFFLELSTVLWEVSGTDTVVQM